MEGIAVCSCCAEAELKGTAAFNGFTGELPKPSESGFRCAAGIRVPKLKSYVKAPGACEMVGESQYTGRNAEASRRRCFP